MVRYSNSFYQSYYDAIDWTDKVDKSKEIKDVFVKDNFKRDIIFKYKTDSKDAKVEHDFSPNSSFNFHAVHQRNMISGKIPLFLY